MGSSTIQERFAEQVGLTPDAIAVSRGEVRLSYRELDERANRLAHRLRRLGVGPEVPVAVLMERSVDLVVALLAVVKSGGFYLPLHDSYPLDRMQWIMDQSAAPVLLADEVTRSRGLPTGAEVVLVDGENGLTGESPESPTVVVDPGQLAYVIYTSGSTGHPKGVAVANRDVIGLVFDSIWDSGRHAKSLMIAPYAFNVSTYEFWVPLLHGGQIVVGPPGDLDVSVLGKLISSEQITGVHLTAGLFRVVAEEAPESLAGVQEVLTGGDVIAPGAVARVLEVNPDLVIRAMYGATELTLFSTHSPMSAGYEAAGVVPLGGPMDNVELHILDERLTPVAPGAVGELYITGRGLARGYFGRPDLTAERFVANPFGGPGERMYRTGDLMRRNADGLLEFVSRAGDQVKIMGFRVELGEIEAVLAKHAGIAHIAVVAKESSTGEKRLVAYVVPETGEVDQAALKAYAGTALPEYMVPAAFVALDALPLTPNGKVDRRALPEPNFENVSTYRAPVGARQEALCKAFADVLGVSQVGVDDSFFDLGGQSLLAMRLISRIRSAIGEELTIAVLFDLPTVAGLAGYLEERAQAA
ncbi:amino acid adenylation domain-containing protein [Actinokineospora alba]|uniref:Amino acid adenylation domain-containing protein n=1 Tax=Actinokineospora alba TaxID=504798 RepID=A0A1H0HCE4_9PSEU|nr:non-ribosomal peptide synthetase [Actinokineospora alba]TDP64944.1 amino acid adenylation domain-containing protein [Actinokineospora alba]SDH49965.1 amino acid adenylation domain-containing protein [Actinokineospora alba]SDO16734.1 amino acid adenylation domain-containing protein [Actinokineospora alba]